MDRNTRVNIASRTNNGAIVVIHFKDEIGCCNYEPDIEISTSRHVRQLAIVITPFSTAQQLANRLSRVVETPDNGTPTEIPLSTTDNSQSCEMNRHVSSSPTNTSCQQPEEEEGEIIQNHETDIPTQTPAKTSDIACHTSLASPETQITTKGSGYIGDVEENAAESSSCEPSTDKASDLPVNHDQNHDSSLSKEEL